MVLLITVTMMYIRSPEFINLVAGNVEEVIFWSGKIVFLNVSDQDAYIPLNQRA